MTPHTRSSRRRFQKYQEDSKKKAKTRRTEKILAWHSQERSTLRTRSFGELFRTFLGRLAPYRGSMSIALGTLTIATESIAADDVQCSDESNNGGTADHYVLLTVRDTGIGIPKSDLDRVFDPFFTTKGVGKGSGLGLSVVYGFVRQSGGEIRIESALGKGTAIRIYLPTAEEGTEAADTSFPELQELEGNGETILIVEDDMEMRSMAKRMLTGLNYRVVEAEDAFAALKLLESTPDIDLLFTDVILPKGLNGVELAKKARLRHDKLKVLLTSGYLGEFPESVDHSDLGADLVEKPYRKRVLAKKIRETLASAP